MVYCIHALHSQSTILKIELPELYLKVHLDLNGQWARIDCNKRMSQSWSNPMTCKAALAHVVPGGLMS